MWVAAEADLPPALHVTVIGHEPCVVRLPISQLQLTAPDPLAFFGPRPWAWEGPDLYSTTIEQDAPATVRAPIVASWFVPIGEVKLVIVTFSDPLIGLGVGFVVENLERRWLGRVAVWPYDAHRLSIFEYERDAPAASLSVPVMAWPVSTHKVSDEEIS
jgi:hypothetical protein